MKKILCILLVLSMFIQSVVADEYSKLYDLVVPTSYTTFNVNGGLGDVGGNTRRLYYRQNVIELSAVSGSFDIDAEANASYRYFNQTDIDALNLQAFANVQLGTITNSVFFNINPTYYSYDLDLNGFPGFWYVGGGVNATTTFSSFTFNLMPEAAIGIGRIYSIYNVYKAKTMMENLGVTPTAEKVEAVVSLFQKENEYFNKFSDNNSLEYLDYYQKLADAMGIGDRALEVFLIDNWDAQKFDFERAKFVNMIYGWSAYLSANAEYNSITKAFSIDVGPEAAIGGFLVDDMIYYNANADLMLSYSLGGSVSFMINSTGRLVYLPEDYRWWAEAIADINYSHGALSPFNLDISGAGYYLINSNFRVYAGLRLEDSPGLYMFAGGEIRLW